MSGYGSSMRGIGRGGGEGDEAFLRGFWSLKFDLDTSNFQFLSNKMDYKEEDIEIEVYLEDNPMKQLRVFQ